MKEINWRTSRVIAFLWTYLFLVSLGEEISERKGKEVRKQHRGNEEPGLHEWRIKDELILERSQCLRALLGSH